MKILREIEILTGADEAGFSRITPRHVGLGQAADILQKTVALGNAFIRILPVTCHKRIIGDKLSVGQTEEIRGIITSVIQIIGGKLQKNEPAVAPPVGRLIFRSVKQDITAIQTGQGYFRILFARPDGRV